MIVSYLILLCYMILDVVLDFLHIFIHDCQLLLDLCGFVHDLRFLVIGGEDYELGFVEHAEEVHHRAARCVQGGPGFIAVDELGCFLFVESLAYHSDEEREQNLVHEDLVEHVRQPCGIYHHTGQVESFGGFLPRSCSRRFVLSYLIEPNLVVWLVCCSTSC